MALVRKCCKYQLIIGRQPHSITTAALEWNYRISLVVLLSAAVMSRGASGSQRSGGPSFPPYVHHEAVTSLAASQNRFTCDLYTKLAEKKSGNLFYSPFSVMTALGMTYAGAGGNTEQEMRSTMHLSDDKELIHDAFLDVVSDMKIDAGDYELRTSNMAYMSNKLSLLSQYDKILKEKYQSTAKTVDFGASEDVRQEINAAVEKETNSRIKDLIPSGVLDSLTRMVLVNAVYFKGLWAKQFDEADTHDQEFWTSNTESVKVPMMYKKSKFRLFFDRDLEATVLAMDYQGSRLSMVFVLPDKRDGLAEVEGKLAKTDLSELHRKLREVEVEVTLPRFKLEETLDLVDTLKEMGMKDLFNEASADLSGISGNKDLFVSNVIHKAFLEVNEKGSEAAAATGITIQLMCADLYGPPKFIADHPFVFFIKDNRSGLIIFNGRLLMP
ncbi:leukocyte elastase inhibitor B-like isoform X2 [Portunus trituberculatus]|uniref:leukocyte elastase inhibitor B-like isoform X2 n=1 Tax=Portunus trituberculatus TaxID=210409 RepID=UPI001E1CE580|nr:leukocyte elastase inhibitor B-like isoform X2 [Portunus trituberculatus]